MLMAAPLSASLCVAFMTLRSAMTLSSCSAETSPPLSGSGYVFVHFRQNRRELVVLFLFYFVPCSCIRSDSGQDHGSLTISGKKIIIIHFEEECKPEQGEQEVNSWLSCR